MNKDYNNYGTLLWKSPEFCLWNWLLEGVQLVSHCDMVEGGLSENGGKVVTRGIDEMWLLTQATNWGFEAGPASWVCDLSAIPQDPSLEGHHIGLTFCCGHLEILKICATGSLIFIFSPGPANFVVRQGLRGVFLCILTGHLSARCSFLH